MPNDLKKKTVRGLLWNAAGSWGSQAASFAVFLVLARLLEPEAFGIIALAGAAVAFLQPLVNLGLPTAIVQRKDLEDDHLHSAFWASIMASLLLSLLALLAAPWVASWFDEPQLAPVLPAMTATLVVAAANGTHQAILQRDHDFRSLTLRRFGGVLTGAVVGISMALNGYGVWSLVGRELATYAMNTVILWHLSPWRPRARISVPHLYSLMRIGIPQTGSAFLTFANRRSDDVIVGYFLGTTALGYYSIAYRLLTVGTQLLTHIATPVAVSTFSRLQSHKDRLRAAYLRTIHASALIGFPAFIGLSVVAQDFVVLAFGSQWAPSGAVASILVLAGAAHSVLILNGSLIIATGKPHWRFLFLLMNAVLNIGVFLIAVHFGLLWLAAGYVCRTYLVSPVSAAMVRRLTGALFRDMLRQLARPMGATAVLAATVVGVRALATQADWLSGETALVFILSILSGALAYTVMLLLIDRESVRQIASDLMTRNEA